MDKNKKRGMISDCARITGLTVGVAMLAACAPPNALAPVNATITFNNANCPQSVSPDPIPIQGSKRILWQSDPADIEYKIYYDPFRGRPLDSKKDGSLRSPPIDPNSPLIEYKYTVIGESCTHAPLDPRIVVN